MKAFLIPPVPHLREFSEDREYHLTLTHLFRSTDPSLKEYSRFYQSESYRGKYIILDNSAHELQSGQSIDVLLEVAEKIGTSEIVLPDHLFRGDETYSKTSKALDYLELHPDTYSFLSTQNFMVVPQGSSLAEYSECAEQLVERFFRSVERLPCLQDRRCIIGVSKDYEIWDLLRILETVIFPLQDVFHTEIHLLGWGRDLWALDTISLQYGSRIRSVDSAKPFVYGLSGILLDPMKEIPKYPTRPENYFTAPLTETQIAACYHNIAIFDILSRTKSFDEVKHHLLAM